MLREIVAAVDAGRAPFTGLVPCHKPTRVELKLLTGGAPALLAAGTTLLAPDISRSSQSDEESLRPIALCDRVDYTLGVGPDPKKAEKAQNAYLRVLRQAAEATGDRRIEAACRLLETPGIGLELLRACSKTAGMLDRQVGLSKLKEYRIALCDAEGQPLYDDATFQAWWVRHVYRTLSEGASKEQTCSVCGRHNKIIRTTAGSVLVNRKSVKVSSFKPSSFSSYGQKQTEQASICEECDAKISCGLNALAHDKNGHTIIYERLDSSNNLDALNSLSAFYWVSPSTTRRGSEFDSLDLKPATIEFDKVDFAETAQRLPELIGMGDAAAEPDGALVGKLIEAVRRSGSAARAQIDATQYNLALLSANETRLVIREFHAANLGVVLESASRYFETARGPSGRIYGLARLVGTLTRLGGDGKLQAIRQMTRAALFGDRLPASVLAGVPESVARALASSAAKVSLPAAEDRDGGKGTGGKSGGGDKPKRKAGKGNKPEPEPVPGPTRDAVGALYSFFAGSNEMKLNETSSYKAGEILALADEIHRLCDPRIPKAIGERHIMLATQRPLQAMSAVLPKLSAVYLPRVARDRGQAVADQLRRQLGELQAQLAATGLPDNPGTEERAALQFGYFTAAAALAKEREARIASARGRTAGEQADERVS